MAKEISIEELLKPRYKVIADFPGNYWKVDQIITTDHSLWEISDYKLAPEFVLNYPHLFKPLSWWEERSPEEMPKYLKDVGDGEIYKVREWLTNKESVIWLNKNKKMNHTGFHQASSIHFVPATESEYLTYINSQTKSPVNK